MRNYIKNCILIKFEKNEIKDFEKNNYFTKKKLKNIKLQKYQTFLFYQNSIIIH